ncbi:MULTISPECIES: NAD(P)-dependent alcohol dehydrogenase [unclassified Nocardiopsis]|uniref:NAD(P)-dependent alcohol dehydrogenase n=1 Tax=unclassified Nocardiopsis TaxID=2649073 RepID=UPI001F4208DC|nr:MULTISPECIES: NAD(P)-dependent alcohol dehydrogenase [unclassified Nocardiopsis]
MSTAVMRAVVQDGYGPPDVLRVARVPVPVPGDHGVLVRVHAASVNAYDWHVMRGDPYLARLMDRSVFGLRGPRVRVRGRDFAGRVEAVGAGVTRWRPGDEVYGEADAAFAEYVCVDEGAALPKPANLTFEQAAAVPLAGTTAQAGLGPVGRVEPGHRVLVNGASGGVGTFAVQIARALGARVTAVCSTRNADLVRSLGAERVVDYTREDFTRGGQRHDLVLDLVGNRSLGALRRAVTPTGTLVLSGGGVSRGGSPVGPMRLLLTGRALAPLLRQRVLLLGEEPRARARTELERLLASGQVVPVVERTFPLARTPEAIRHLEVEHARAKVVVTV